MAGSILHVRFLTSYADNVRCLHVDHFGFRRRFRRRFRCRFGREPASGRRSRRATRPSPVRQDVHRPRGIASVRRGLLRRTQRFGRRHLPGGARSAAARRLGACLLSGAGQLRRGGRDRRGQEPLLHELHPGGNDARHLRHGRPLHVIRKREPPHPDRLPLPHARPALNPSSSSIHSSACGLTTSVSPRSTVAPGSIGISTSRGPLTIGSTRGPTRTDIS